MYKKYSDLTTMDFKVGDHVKWFVSEKYISPYIGVVTHVCPKTNKIWVEFPVGGNQQRDPSELIHVQRAQGRSPVNEDTGYDSYEKIVSEINRGSIRDKLIKVDKDNDKDNDKAKIKKMASKVAYNFADKIVTKIASDIIECINDNKTTIQAYQYIYPLYNKVCSDNFIRYAIFKVYNLKGEE